MTEKAYTGGSMKLNGEAMHDFRKRFVESEDK